MSSVNSIVLKRPEIFWEPDSSTRVRDLDDSSHSFSCAYIPTCIVKLIASHCERYTLEQLKLTSKVFYKAALDYEALIIQKLFREIASSEGRDVDFPMASWDCAKIKKQLYDRERALFANQVVGKELAAIDFRHCQLTSIPRQTFELTLLSALNLQSNFLVSIPKEIGLLTNLKVLQLSANAIVRFPTEIELCKELQEIDLSENGLTRLPENISFCLSLKNLNIATNSLVDLAEISKLTTLKELRADGNCLESLSCWKHVKNSRLKEVNLDRNNLTSLEGIEGLLALESLSVRHNQLKRSSGVENANVKGLYIENNQLESLSVVKTFPHLIELHVSDNPIKSLEGIESCADLKIFYAKSIRPQGHSARMYGDVLNSIGECQKLKELYLMGNQLTAVPQGILLCKNLKTLNLACNELTSISEIRTMKTIKFLYANNNRLANCEESPSFSGLSGSKMGSETSPPRAEFF